MAAPDQLDKTLWDLDLRPFRRRAQVLRTDFGCFAIIVAFVVIMISAIVFANILTSPASNPLLQAG
jgi:hypothetical protein